jgi:subfamily B ATP-binding cassette protein HlyB/CyaB
MTKELRSPIDAGAGALAFALNVLGISADASQIQHETGKSYLEEDDLLRAARRFPVKARAHRSTFARLLKTPLPALAAVKGGGWLVVGRAGEDKLLIQDPFAPRPELSSRSAFLERWTGRLILLTRRAPLHDPMRRFGIGWFVGAMKKYRFALAEVLVASFVLQIFALLTPIFFQVVIDKVLVHRGLSTLEVLAAGLGILSLYEIILGGIRTYLFAHTTNRIDVELGARLFSHLLALPMGYFQARRVGDSVARVRELETIRQFLTSSALTLVLDLFFAILFIAVLFIYSPQLTIVVVCALPLYAILSLSVIPGFRARLSEKFARNAENQAFLVEAVAGVETIKSMALEPVLQRRWEEQLSGYVTAAFRVVGLGTFGTQTATLVSKIVMVLILFLGAKLVIDNIMTVGELVAFNMLASQLAAPVLRLAQLGQDFQQARVSIDRLGDILNTAPEPGQRGQAGLPPIKGNIRLEMVNFRYRIDTQPVLRDISLDIPAGQILGVVGSSGSGKSTLARLIQRLYVPEAGRVLVDEIDLGLADPAWLRRQIGVVLQESVLFNRTARENIALSDPAMSLDRVIEAAQLAGAHEFISRLPEAYDTVIGERGASLSGGQRQRIAMARALVTNPRILILDEATSALDYESEAAIQKNMRQICQNRTVIVIAHRLSTIRIADRIITLEQGQIIEDDTHDALLRAEGRYAQLWRMQTAGAGVLTAVVGA